MFYFDRTLVVRTREPWLAAVLTPCLHHTLLVRLKVGCVDANLINPRGKRPLDLKVQSSTLRPKGSKELQVTCCQRSCNSAAWPRSRCGTLRVPPSAAHCSVQVFSHGSAPIRAPWPSRFPLGQAKKLGVVARPARICRSSLRSSPLSMYLASPQRGRRVFLSKLVRSPMNARQAM
jgi:hypothetical protein